MADNPYGVTTFSFDNTQQAHPQLFTDLKNNGFGWLRYQLPWNVIEPTKTTPPTYYWTGLDSVVETANANGINLDFVLQPLPPSGYPLQTNSTNSSVTYAEANSFATFATAVASRYNGSVNGPTTHNPMTVQALEIGNEEWDSAGSGTDSNAYNNRAASYYINVLPTVSAAIKTAYPGVKIGMCAIWWDQMQHLHDFLNDIYTASTTMKNNFDFVNTHFYTAESGSSGMIDPGKWCYDAFGSTIPSFHQYWAQLQSVMNTNGDSGKEIWITEYGWYTHQYIGANQRRSANNLVNYDVQQRNFWTTFESARLSGIVAKMFFWTLDYAQLPAINADANSNPISDAYSLALKSTVSGVTSTYYAPAFTQIKNYSARYPTWGVQKGSTAPVQGIDTFVNSKNTPNARDDNTTSFGTPSDQSSWTHPGGTGSPSFTASEGNLAASGSNFDYFRLGTTNVLSQEVQLRCMTGAAGDTVGVCARLTGTSNATMTCYTLTISGNTLSINKIVNGGTPTTLATQSITQTSGTFYRLRFRVYNSGSNTILKGRFWTEGILSQRSTIDGAGQITTISGLAQEPNNWTITATDTSNTLPTGGYGIVGKCTTSTKVQFDGFIAVDATNIVTKFKSAATITNTGAGTLTFTASVAASWGSIDVSSGSLSANASQVITVSADVASLSSGTYNDTLTITSNGGNLSIPVTFTVQ